MMGNRKWLEYEEREKKQSSERFPLNSDDDGKEEERNALSVVLSLLELADVDQGRKSWLNV